MESLETIKDWLDSIGIPFTEGPLNLNWVAIMKTVQADTHAFFKDGGWTFLSVESDEDQSESEEESAYEESESEASFGEDSDDSFGSDDDDASADEGSYDGSDSESGRKFFLLPLSFFLLIFFLFSSLLSRYHFSFSRNYG